MRAVTPLRIADPVRIPPLNGHTPTPARLDTAAGSGADGEEGTSPVHRYRWWPVEVPAARPSLSLAGRRVAVLGGTGEERNQVVAALTAAGAVAVPAPTAADVPGGWGGPGDERLVDVMAAFVAATGGLDGIVDLGLAEPFALDGGEPWVEPFCATVALTRAVYDDWAAEHGANRLVYVTVTRMGGRMGYDGQGIGQPLGGLWAGFVKSLPQELPNCRVKVLDLDAGELSRLGELVATEAATPELYEVGYRDGVRVTLAAGTEAVPAPRITYGPGDVVVFSGGARGIGFAAARRLAARTGCRVVVTGRAALSEGEAWVGLSDEEFQADCRHRLVERPDGRPLGEVRKENERRVAAREVVANLAAARSEGLRVDYRACDVTDAAAVGDLLGGIGPGVRAVVHNAGIAAPTRLRSKPLATVVNVVRAKVAGFCNLVVALPGGEGLATFTNVGSVSGRTGGMIGQIDYGAANEALTRLGFWAQATRGIPVTTLAWTTWARLGLIANYDAALRYGSAVPVDDGVDRWLRELTAAQPGEVMFLGSLGRAVSPRQPDGFSRFREHPDLNWILTARHHLGEIVRFAPFRSSESRNHLVADDQPALGELRREGRPVLSPSVALELAVSVGDWVTMEGWPLLHLLELRDVCLDFAALAFTDGTLTLTKTGTGHADGGRWLVDVAFTRGGPDRPGTPNGSAGPTNAGHAQLVLGHDAPALDLDPPVAADLAAVAPGTGEPWPVPAAVGGLAWRGAVHRDGPWRRVGAVVRGEVRPTPGSDAWVRPVPPAAALPIAAVEALTRAAVVSSGPSARSGAGAGATVRSLRIRRLRLGRGGPEAAVVGRPTQRRWVVVDGEGRPILDAEDVEVSFT